MFSIGVNDLSRFCAVVKSEATIIGLALHDFPDLPPDFLLPPLLELDSSLPPSSLLDSDELDSEELDSAVEDDSLDDELLDDELEEVLADGVELEAADDAAEAAALLTLDVALDVAELTTPLTTFDVTWLCVC